MVSFGSSNGLMLNWCQAITWISDEPSSLTTYVITSSQLVPGDPKHLQCMVYVGLNGGKLLKSCHPWLNSTNWFIIKQKQSQKMHGKSSYNFMVMVTVPHTGIILCMCSANERRYIVTSSPISWVHTQNDPCAHMLYSIVMQSICFKGLTHVEKIMQDQQKCDQHNSHDMHFFFSRK